MSELVESGQNFYLNCEQFNSSDTYAPAQIRISDRDDILSRQDKWMCHVTRFAIDTQSSLFYLPPNSDATCTLTSFTFRDVADHRIDQTKHFVDQRTVSLAEGASTLANFLDLLNSGVPNLLPRHTDQDRLNHVAGAADTARCGEWSVTGSGSFQFKAKIKDPSAPNAGPHPFDTASNEYFVNIKMSEAMRKILGFENATLNILSNESSVRTYRRMLSNVISILPAYRNNIDNWRWNGTWQQHGLNAWYTEMWYILRHIIMEGVPLNANGSVASQGSHHVYHTGNEAVSEVGFWRHNDFLISDYREAWADNATMAREMTQFSYIHSHNHNQVTGDTVTIASSYDLNDDIVPRVDFTWDQYHHGATAIHQYPVAASRGRPAYINNSKQVWGTWNRAYILGIPNARQIQVNKTILTDLAFDSNIHDGKVGSAPLVGDTVYIPGSANRDGSGELEVGVPLDHMHFQRAIVLEVSETTCVRAPGKTADACYLLTLDTTIEQGVERILALIPDNGDGDPKARIIYGTRRIPYSPLVYIARCPIAIFRNGDELKFTTAEDFPVVVGNQVYVGHRFSDSKVPHTVTSVNYLTGEVTMTAEGVDIPQDTIVIGFANDSVYQAVLEADAVNRDITAVASFIKNTTMRVDHPGMKTQVGKMENAFNTHRSLKNIDISPSTAYGVHVLTESEMGVPQASGIDLQTGNVSVNSGIVRGGDNNNDNTFACYDFQAFIGASPYFNEILPLLNDLNNANLCPSNYFFLEAPAKEGPADYEDVQFGNFISGHIQEDWSIIMEHALDNDTEANDGVLTYAAPYFGNPTTSIHGNHIIEARLAETPYKLCGVVTLPVRNYGGSTNKSSMKFIGYTFDRASYPGMVFDPNHQFDMSINHGAGGQPALFSKYTMVSGYKEMDAVQVLYKANTTISIKDNSRGMNLSVRSMDSFTSSLNGQVDLAFPYKSISLTSPDLLAVPERTGDANSLQPILSSYSIPSVFESSLSVTGEVNGFSSTPYGTVSFSEGGARRYHNLTAIPGGLRQFTLYAVLDPKDDRYAKTPIKLPPNGRFSCQLLFVLKT